MQLLSALQGPPAVFCLQDCASQYAPAPHSLLLVHSTVAHLDVDGSHTLLPAQSVAFSHEEPGGRAHWHA